MSVSELDCELLYVTMAGPTAGQPTFVEGRSGFYYLQERRKDLETVSGSYLLIFESFPAASGAVKFSV